MKYFTYISYVIMNDFEQNIFRTLLYYGIFDHPLTIDELFLLFPKNSISRTQFKRSVDELVSQNKISQSHGLYQIINDKKSLKEVRKQRERIAMKRIVIANIMGFVIKQFPYVRGVFLSGDLSKGVATPASDIDYVVITAPNRLWICRTLLILFKKIFLFNSRKYFCLNYFVTENHLEVTEHNYYTATEVAHLKPLYNFPLFLKYMNDNSWIKRYFPNYALNEFVNYSSDKYSGIIQSACEILIPNRVADSFDVYLKNKMISIWKTRYPELSEEARDRIFLSTDDESRAFVGNFSDKILSMYQAKLHQHGLA